ncbi:hypothetical protein HS7_00790 [Sulfolobales archaeon HS-7]|nr:hypothetical protein HS7_00790 [Sulfolobales archaeon HS-7]
MILTKFKGTEERHLRFILVKYVALLVSFLVLFYRKSHISKILLIGLFNKNIE